ncbi:MAG: hypothetical protein AAGA88_01190 [Pseudomonadota bacterium]
MSDTALDRGGVYGMRMTEFSRALAKRGHEVVLLAPRGATNQPDHHRSFKGAGTLRTVTLNRTPTLYKQVHQRFEDHPIAQKAVTAASLLFLGGTDPGWTRAICKEAPSILFDVKPDLIWATFGSLSTLSGAKSMAKAAKCPWVIDLKDNTELYIPRAVRGHVARQFSSAHAITSNSSFHGDIGSRWLKRGHTVVYSGVSERSPVRIEEIIRNRSFQISLVGSVYCDQALNVFLKTLAVWVSNRSQFDRAKIRVRYCGNDFERVRRHFARVQMPCSWHATGNIQHDEFLRVCQSSAVNCYIWAPFTFHHKSLELVAIGQPVVSFRGEHPETLRLANEIGGTLISCPDEHTVTKTLDRVWTDWKSHHQTFCSIDCKDLTWAVGAERLEALFDAVLAGERKISRAWIAGFQTAQVRSS